MATQSWSWVAHKLWVGLRLRCPNCEQGEMFTSLMNIRRECPVCGVRFERQSGESVGGMYFNLGIASMTSLGGFFIADALFHPPLWPHIVFWTVYILLFCLLFYRHSRGLWVAISYVTGGVQRDEDYQRMREVRGETEKKIASRR